MEQRLEKERSSQEEEKEQTKQDSEEESKGDDGFEITEIRNLQS